MTWSKSAVVSSTVLVIDFIIIVAVAVHLSSGIITITSSYVAITSGGTPVSSRCSSKSSYSTLSSLSSSSSFRAAVKTSMDQASSEAGSPRPVRIVRNEDSTIILVCRIIYSSSSAAVPMFWLDGIEQLAVGWECFKLVSDGIDDLYSVFWAWRQVKH